MKKIVVTGKTIDEALNRGLAEWSTTKDRVTMTVLEQPTKGLLGFWGVKPAKIELEFLMDPIEETVKFLKEVFTAMQVVVDVNVSKERDGTLFELRGSELGILIGRRGQTLDSLQYLANIVANRYATSHFKVILDAEDFRDRRKKTLEELSLRLASRAIKSNKEVVLEPMSSLERKIIHAKLQDHPNVKTFSKGDEPNRRIVISPR